MLGSERWGWLPGLECGGFGCRGLSAGAGGWV